MSSWNLMKEPELLDHERLDVYRLAVEFDGLVASSLPRRGHRQLRDQVQRAVMGAVLNIAEGAGRRGPPDKRRFYAMARGSVTESAAALDLLRNRGALSADAYGRLRAVIIRLVQMLTRLSESKADSPPPRDP